MAYQPKGLLRNPNDVFVSSINNYIYIVECNHRIRKILNTGDIVTIAGNGEKGYSGDGGLAINAQLCDPTSVFVSVRDEVYIADCGNDRIRKILRNGIIVTIAGNGTAGYSGDGGPAINAQLCGPTSVFVSSSDEVYFVERENNVVRKILRNGNIVTIAGNGEEGYSGDGGPAINAELYCPSSVFVSTSDEVYIADSGNNRIRKILRNGNIETCYEYASPSEVLNEIDIFISSNDEVYFSDCCNHRIRKIFTNGDIKTIAGTGEREYNGDYGPATSVQLNYPNRVFVSSNDEVYISDFGNSRIMKILEDGYIVTISGDYYNEDYDSPFDISIYPHIGGTYSKNLGFNLKKYERDLLNSSIYAFIPLLEKMSPFFCKFILKNEALMALMSSAQQEIIQKLIDSLIYNRELKLEFSNNEILDVLSILGLFKNNEFIGLKKSCTFKFIQSLTIHSVSYEWERVETYLSQCKNQLHLENYLLEHINTYCVEFATIQMKIPGGTNSLPNLPIIVKNATGILSAQSLKQPKSIVLDEQIEIELMSIEQLFNDSNTSDLKIQIAKDQYWYCHKTILCSSSTFFNAMINSGTTFTDFNNDIFIPDPSDDLELLEIIVQACYRIPFKVKPEKVMNLLDLAVKHEMEYLVLYCKNNIKLSVTNYLDTALALENYFDSQCFSVFYEGLIQFGIKNRKEIFADCETIPKLPQKLLHSIFHKFSQDF